MPLIDDYSQQTDRRPSHRSAWILVIVAASLVWLVVAFLLSYRPRAAAPSTGPASVTAARQSNARQVVQMAQRMSSFGGPTQAIRLLESLGPNPVMPAEDKHGYFRLAADSYLQAKKPLKAAAYYQRFLTMGLQVADAECQSCHPPSSQLSPTKPSDLLSSSLGTSYAKALRKAKQLTSTRDVLKARMAKHQAEAPRLHLLLYHLELARGDLKAAAPHAAAVTALDAAAR